jgi:hypothetical protein
METTKNWRLLIVIRSDFNIEQFGLIRLASSISSDIPFESQNFSNHPLENKYSKSNPHNNHIHPVFDFTVNRYFIFFHKIQNRVNRYLFFIQSNIRFEISSKAFSRLTLTISVVKSDFSRMILALLL